MENFREWRRQYPAQVDYQLRRITSEDELVVAEVSISYDGSPWMFAVGIFEFSGDRCPASAST